MSDLNTIRAEIKNWERSFKQTNNRPPTVDDIKKDNVIADRYKQYKKLSKATTNLTAEPTAPPSTPPRTTRLKDPPSLIPSRSCVVETTVPLNTFNPFSPQKKPKGKDSQKETDHYIQSELEIHSNAFDKACSRARTRTRTRSLSPSSFPSVNQTHPLPSPSSSVFSLNPPQILAGAVSRARKRLRGEPVSPSPNKDKRRRVIPPTTISFPSLNFNAVDSDDDESNADTSFVDNSPIKSPFGGKSFSRLFDESATSLDTLHAVNKTREIPSFGIDNVTSLSMHDAANDTKRVKEVLGRRQQKSDAGRPSLTHSIVNHPSGSLATQENGNISQAKIAFNANPSSTKRPFSDDELEPVNIPRTRSPLLPPSPPPHNMSGRASAKPLQHKGNSKANKGRKKMKIDEKPDNHDSDDSVLPVPLKIINRKTTRPLHAVGDVDDLELDSDSILGYAQFAALHPSSPITHQQDHGSIEVDLPDKLRSVLALRSSASKSQVSEEDQLVKGLLYGRRVTHYDPNKGGEIWDVGEDDLGNLDEGKDRYTDGEDEWECEPVPWEVGEL